MLFYCVKFLYVYLSYDDMVSVSRHRHVCTNVCLPETTSDGTFDSLPLQHPKCDPSLSLTSPSPLPYYAFTLTFTLHHYPYLYPSPLPLPSITTTITFTRNTILQRKSRKYQSTTRVQPSPSPSAFTPILTLHLYPYLQ